MSKKMKNLQNNWKTFLLNEGQVPDISVWIQSLRENISLLKPKSMRESKRIELMKHQLNEIRRASNRLQKENKMLQEENQTLKEQKDNNKE